MPHIYRCKQDAICRIYIFIYRCIWQYAKHISLQAGGNMPGAENICVRLLPLDLVHILPNNLPQFGILSSLCAICRSREYIYVWDYWHSQQLLLLHCIPHPRDNFPNFVICNICNMLIWLYWHSQKLLLHIWPILQLPLIAQWTFVRTQITPQVNPGRSSWSTKILFNSVHFEGE